MSSVACDKRPTKDQPCHSVGRQHSQPFGPAASEQRHVALLVWRSLTCSMCTEAMLIFLSVLPRGGRLDPFCHGTGDTEVNKEKKAGESGGGGGGTATHRWGEEKNTSAEEKAIHVKLRIRTAHNSSPETLRLHVKSLERKSGPQI